jgi:hypothetical protein
MFDIIGGALVGELVGLGRKKLAKLSEEEPLQKAWSDACKSVVEYTADAIERGGSDSFQPPALDRRMNDYADLFSLPRPDEILRMLLEGWRERKQALSSGHASPFFSAEESEVNPILTKLANRFFIEVAQIPKYRDPLLVWAALHMSPISQGSGSGISMVDEYLGTFAEAATRPDGPQPDQARFPLNCSLAEEAAEFPVGKLFDRVRNFRYVFLMGPAGGGKTEALNRLISALLADRTATPNILPVLVDAARVSGFADQFLQFYNGQDELFPIVWDRFLSEALVPISVKTLDDMGQDAVPFLIIDEPWITGTPSASSILKF